MLWNSTHNDLKEYKAKHESCETLAEAASLLIDSGIDREWYRKRYLSFKKKYNKIKRNTAWYVALGLIIGIGVGLLI